MICINIQYNIKKMIKTENLYLLGMAKLILLWQIKKPTCFYIHTMRNSILPDLKRLKIHFRYNVAIRMLIFSPLWQKPMWLNQLYY